MTLIPLPGLDRIPGLRSLPGPADVLVLMTSITDTVESVLALTPRLVELVARAELIVTDAERLVRRIQRTRDNADLVVARTDALVTRSTALVERTEVPLDRLVFLLDSLEPALLKLRPTLERLADTTDPAEIDALVTLIDHLPGLVGQLERDVLPVMTTLGSVAPDLHDLLDVSRELNEILGKVPGISRIKKKVEEQQAADELQDASR